MKAVVFIRHAQSEANVSHILSDDFVGNPLSDFGVSQAEAVAEELARLSKAKLLFSSPVLRAKQTADIIARRIGALPKSDARLKERGMGSLNNKKFSSAESMENAFMEEIKSNYIHGLESWDRLKSRIREFICALDGSVTIAVTHRDPIAAALGSSDPKYDDDTIPGRVLNTFPNPQPL